MPGSGSRGRRRGRLSLPRRRVAAAVAAAAAAAAGALAFAVGMRGGGAETGMGAHAATVPTVSVERRDLAITEDVAGTLGFGEAHPVLAGAAGTVTKLPEEGTTVEPGSVLYRIDGAPVVLLHGAQPAWRAIEAGIPDGDDIQQLERNLRALGFDAGGTLEVDRRFDFATRAAIQAWQRALGVEATGRVELGAVVFLEGPRRVAQLDVPVGAGVTEGTELLHTTSTERIVSIDLDAADQEIVQLDEPVEVELPGGATVDGTIVFIGRVAESAEAAGSAEPSPPTIDVRVAVDGDLGDFDEAPVAVRVATELKSDVLAVPVTALRPVPGGSYALEVVGDDGRRHRVVVETGLFANGYVEVEGPAIAAGTVVADSEAA